MWETVDKEVDGFLKWTRKQKKEFTVRKRNSRVCKKEQWLLLLHKINSAVVGYLDCSSYIDNRHGEPSHELQKRVSCQRLQLQSAWSSAAAAVACLRDFVSAYTYTDLVSSNQWRFYYIVVLLISVTIWIVSAGKRIWRTVPKKVKKTLYFLSNIAPNPNRI